MAASSMSSVCFQVPGEIARSVKRLPGELERLAALVRYFEQSAGSGAARSLSGRADDVLTRTGIEHAAVRARQSALLRLGEDDGGAAAENQRWCVVVAEALRDELFPASAGRPGVTGVMPGRTVDDAAGSSHRTAQQLAPGAEWTPVGDWEAVEAALLDESTGPGSVAVVMVRTPLGRPASGDRLPLGREGHVWVGYHPRHDGREDTRPVWVEVVRGARDFAAHGSHEGVRLLDGHPASPLLEARAVVIGPTGRVASDVLVPFRASSSLSHALVDPATNPAYASPTGRTGPSAGRDWVADWFPATRRGVMSVRSQDLRQIDAAVRRLQRNRDDDTARREVLVRTAVWRSGKDARSSLWGAVEALRDQVSDELWEAASPNHLRLIRYAEAAEAFDSRLGQYLMNRPRATEAVREVVRALWEFLERKEPDKLVQLGIDPTELRTSSGNVINRVDVLRSAMEEGNLRELSSMLFGAASREVLSNYLYIDGYSPWPSLKPERSYRIEEDSDDRLIPLKDIYPPVSQREFDVAGVEQDGEWYVRWDFARDSLSLPLHSPPHMDGDRTGGLVATGTSGSILRILETMYRFQEHAGKRFNFPELILGLIGSMLVGGHHTAHELLRAVGLWGHSAEFGFSYTDGWSRYRTIPYLSEAELRNVAVGGLFPDEIALGLTPSVPENVVPATAYDLLKALQVPADSWAAELDLDARGRALAPYRPRRSAGPATRIAVWAGYWSARQDYLAALDEEMSLRDEAHRGGRAGGLWRSARAAVDDREAELDAAERLVREMGHHPRELGARLARLTEREARRRVSAAPLPQARRGQDEPGRPDPWEPSGIVARMALTQDSRADDLNRDILHEELDRLRPADPRAARLRAVLASYGSPGSSDRVTPSDGPETGRTTVGSRDSAGPARPVEPAELRSALADLNSFGVYRATSAAPAGTVWKEPQLFESGLNPLPKGSGGLRKFFTRKSTKPAVRDRNAGPPVQPAASDVPKHLPVVRLRDQDIAKILTRPITVQGRTIGISLHDNDDWSLRERNWADFDPGSQVYASYPYMELITRSEPYPWAGREAFYVTMHGQHDRVKAYARSGNSLKVTILDAAGLARIVEADPNFRRMRQGNPNLQLVLVICESGLTREHSLAQQMADLLGLTVHAPNGKTALTPSQRLGAAALTVYYQDEDAGVFLTFTPGTRSGDLPYGRPAHAESAGGPSENSAPRPLNQASRLRGGAPDLVGEWRKVSSTGAFIRSANLKRIDAAVSRLSEDRENASLMRAVLSAVADWQKEKSPSSDRWEAVERLGVQVRAELEAAGGPGRLTQELVRSQWPHGRRETDSLSVAYGDDVFGTRVLPPAPDFMALDVRAVPAARMSGLLELLDLRNASSPETVDARRVRSLPTRSVVQGRYTTPDRPPGDLREIPYIQHQIWFGGPLFDDGAVRGEFQRIIARNTRTNTGFTSVLWTDVPREEFIRAARSRKPLSGRLAEVAQMLKWAQSADVLLLNVDELLSEAQLVGLHPSVRRLARYARAERLRTVGPGYASSSDATRALILYLIGGFYNDCDNEIQQSLGDFMGRVAESRDGIALIQDETGKTDISAQISSAANPALLQYIDVMAGNAVRNLEDLYPRFLAGMGVHGASSDPVQNAVSPREETILRTGHAHQDLAGRLGYRERTRGSGERVSALSQMLALGPDLVETGEARSWHGTPPRSHDHGDWLLEVAQSTVMQIQREVINRRGVVNLYAVADIVDQVAGPRRLDVWRSSLEFASRLTVVRDKLSAFSAIPPAGRQDSVPAEVLAEVRSRFPAAGTYLPEDEASDTESLLVFGDGTDPGPASAGNRFTGLRNPVIRTALTESDHTNALMRKLLQDRLDDLAPDSPDRGRVLEALSTYSPSSARSAVEESGIATGDPVPATGRGTADENAAAREPDTPEARATVLSPSSTADPLPAGRAPERPSPSARELLTGLRQYTVVPEVSDAGATAVTGVDLFGRWVPRPTPDFLREVDYDRLTPEQVLHFFDRVDLLKRTPTPAEMDLAAWRTEQYAGSVVRPPAGRPLTGWSPDPAAPPLPESVRLGIPKIWFSIWLGGVPQSTGRSARFWTSLAASADRHRDIMFVLLTDVTREEVTDALSATTEPHSRREANVREMVAWAREHGIRLVNVHELYHAGHPMPLHKEFLYLLARRNGPSMAAASDMLRLMLLDTFGAMYMDGNKTLLPGRDPFREAAETPTLFTYSEGANSAFVAPARHPLTRALLEETGRSYAKDQTTLYRDALSWQGIDRNVGVNLSRRVPVMEQTGPFMVVRTLVNAGWYIHPRSQLPYGAPHDPHFRDVPSEHTPEGSWIYSSPSPEKPQLTEEQVYAVVADITDTLTADLFNLRGHLDLTAIEEALGTLPDPEAGLSAALMYLASREDLRTRVRGYFGHQQQAVKVGSSRPTRRKTEFPHLQVARRFLHDLPAHPALIGDRGGWWLLHKRATRAVLLPPGQDLPTPADLWTADTATRPDDFGLYRLPTDPWPDSRLEDALNRVQRDPTLTETERKAARRVVTNDVAPAGRNKLRSHLWSPAAREEARALTARILADDPLLALPRDYAPAQPLPFPEGVEARILPLHHGRAMTRPVLAAVIRAVVLSHGAETDGAVPRADDSVAATGPLTAPVRERYWAGGGSATLSARSVPPTEDSGVHPAEQESDPGIGEEWLRAWAASRNWTADFALAQYEQASGIVGRALNYHLTIGQGEVETEYRRLLRHVVAAVTDARAGAQTTGKGKETEHSAAYEYDEKVVSRLRAVFDSLDMFHHAVTQQAATTASDHSSWVADMELTVRYVSEDAVDVVPGLDVHRVWLLYKHHRALDRPDGVHAYIPGEPYPGSHAVNLTSEGATDGPEPGTEDQAGERSDVSTRADADALVAAFAEEVRPAVRVWTEPVADELDRLTRVLQTPGSRSLVFGTPSGSPVWAVNIGGEVRWMTATMQPAETPLAADGPLLSIDIDDHGRLTGPAAQRLREEGGESTSVKTGFCDLTPGADLSRVLGWRS